MNDSCRGCLLTAICCSKFSVRLKEKALIGSNDAVGILSFVYTDGEGTRVQRRTSRDDICVRHCAAQA